MKTILDNGLTVIIKEQHHAAVVALQMWVNVGSADETPNEAGLSHFIEHMLFKGTNRRGVGDVAKEIEGSGGDINAFTSFDHTVYQIIVASRYAESALDILADTLTNPKFDSEEIDREREVILEEIKRSEDSPSQVASKMLFTTAYVSHPYKNPVIGREEIIRSVDSGKLRNFFQNWYSAGNMILTVAGDVVPREFLKLIDSQFADLPAGAKEKSKRSVEPLQTDPRSLVRSQDINETHIDIALHIPDAHHNDSYALDLLAIILGQGESSWLYHQLKTKDNLVNSIFSCSFIPKDPGIFMISSTLKNETLESAFTEIVRQLNRIKNEQIDGDEFARARTTIEKDYIYQRETVQGIARKLGYFESTMGNYRFEEQYLRKVSTLQPSTIQRVARKYLVPENLTTVILHPDREPCPLDSDKIAKLARELSSPKKRRSVCAKKKTELKREVLDNGIILIAASNHHVPLVSVKLSCLAGLRYETKENNGINNLIASVLTKGTNRRNSLQIAQDMESIGGSIKGGAGRNSLFVHMDVFSRNLEKGFEIFADTLFDSTFDSDILEREKQSILHDIKAQEDNLPAVAFKLFSKTMFKSHPFGMPLLGTKKSLGAIDRTVVLDYYHNMINPKNAVLTVVGDIDIEQTIASVKTLFDRPNRGKDIVVPHFAEPDIKSPRLSETIKEKKQAHLVIGFKSVDFTHQDRYTLEIITAVLAGQSGRLFMKLRDQQSLAYSLTSFNIEGVDTGYFAIYIGTSPEKIEQAIDGIKKEIRLLSSEMVSEEEITRAKKYIVGNYEIDLQQNQSQATSLNFNELYGVGYAETFAYPKKILAQTKEKIIEVAQKYLDLNKSVSAIVRPSR